jgi:acetyl-CoA acyltransferase
MPEAVVLSAVRTPVTRAHKGAFKDTRADDLAAWSLAEAVARSGVDPAAIEDVVLGCAMPEAQQGMNVARIASVRAGLPTSAAAVTVNRFCASGLQAVAYAAQMIRAGEADVVVAGGVESMTAVPMGGDRPSPNPALLCDAPEVYTPMGITAELVAQKYGVNRADQDAFALQSQQRAGAAIAAGAFADELFEVHTRAQDKTGAWQDLTVRADECPRPQTTLEGLAQLRPAFVPKGGTVTAGTSSPLSDGAAALVLCSDRYAKAHGHQALAVFRGFAVAGVPPELMGIGPVEALPRLLGRQGLSVSDLGHIELNEAFAAQSLAVIRELGLDPKKVNPLGGAIALGHPLGCSGAKLSATLVHALRRGDQRYGVVTMCIGGGMGAAGLFERAE